MSSLSPSTRGARSAMSLSDTRQPVTPCATCASGAAARIDVFGIALLAVVTSLVFWLAHVYAHGIADSVARGERVSPVHLRHIARRESSIVEAAAPPVAALLLGALGVISTNTAVWLAFGRMQLSDMGVAMGLQGKMQALFSKMA